MTEQILSLIDEITPTVAANLSEQEKKTKIRELQSLEYQIQAGLKNEKTAIHQLIFSSQKEILLNWAKILETQHYLGVYTEPINTISSHIRKQIGKMDLKADKAKKLLDNIKKILPVQYKSTSESYGKNSPQNSSINTPNELFNKQIISLMDRVSQLASLVRTKAKNNEIESLEDWQYANQAFIDAGAVLTIAEDAIDEKEKVPLNTQHILLTLLATESTLADAARIFFKKRLEHMEDVSKFITVKQMTKFQKGTIKKDLPILKPKTRDAQYFKKSLA